MCCLGYAAVPGCVAHDAATEALLVAVLLVARYVDRPWGWSMKEISCLVYCCSFCASVECVCVNHAPYSHSFLGSFLMELFFQVGETSHYALYIGAFVDARTYTNSLDQVTHVFNPVVAR